MNKKKVLVIGGAGYIGSHTALLLTEAGYKVVVYDNLSTGHAQAVLPPAHFILGDLNEVDKLNQLMKEEQFTAIIHFAASIVVPESVSQPLKYYSNNSINTSKLIELADRHKIHHFIFSSTAAVYGLPDKLPVKETSPVNPINPYGRSKLISEWVLQDVARTSSLSYIALRYFNVAGADPKGRLGQSTPKATHLIKVACQTALGQQDMLPVYGDDYPTPDGTGIRDYIHVTDLAQAHLCALVYLEHDNQSKILNCGYGQGYSVKQIIESVERISQTKIPTKVTSRRSGDPAELIADPTELMTLLDWHPQYNNIDTIVRTAFSWEKQRTF
ncbi:MAG TPA: UDP-glucose 4-epimerase GalE [Desulfohalobiaceae bacterium]|nr:UDP-glucose 4-epimerase GalE [Desulfohalobiaceae bacterium]